MNDRIFTSPIVVKLLGSGRLNKLTELALAEINRRGVDFYPGGIENEFFRRVPAVVAGHTSGDVHKAIVQLSDFFLEMPPVTGGDYPVFIRNCKRAAPKDGELTVQKMHGRLRGEGLLLGEITLEKFLLCRRVECAIQALSDRAVEMELLSCEQVCWAILGRDGLEN